MVDPGTLPNRVVPGDPIAALLNQGRRLRMSWACLVFRPSAAHDELLFLAV
jgi:hypothetical protein